MRHAKLALAVLPIFLFSACSGNNPSVGGSGGAYTAVGGAGITGGSTAAPSQGGSGGAVQTGGSSSLPNSGSSRPAAGGYGRRECDGLARPELRPSRRSTLPTCGQDSPSSLRW